MPPTESAPVLRVYEQPQSAESCIPSLEKALCSADDLGFPLREDTGDRFGNLQHIRKVNRTDTDVAARRPAHLSAILGRLQEGGFVSIPFTLDAALHAMPTVTRYISYVQFMTNPTEAAEVARMTAAESI